MIALGMELLLDTDAKLLAPDSEYVEFCIGTLRRSLVSEHGNEFLTTEKTGDNVMWGGNDDYQKSTQIGAISD